MKSGYKFSSDPNSFSEAVRGSPGLFISSLQKTIQKNYFGQDYGIFALVLSYKYFFPAEVLTQGREGAA